METKYLLLVDYNFNFVGEFMNMFFRDTGVLSNSNSNKYSEISCYYQGNPGASGDKDKEVDLPYNPKRSWECTHLYSAVFGLYYDYIGNCHANFTIIDYHHCLIFNSRYPELTYDIYRVLWKMKFLYLEIPGVTEFDYNFGNSCADIARKLSLKKTLSSYISLTDNEIIDITNQLCFVDYRAKCLKQVVSNTVKRCMVSYYQLNGSNNIFGAAYGSDLADLLEGILSTHKRSFNRFELPNPRRIAINSAGEIQNIINFMSLDRNLKIDQLKTLIRIDIKDNLMNVLLEKEMGKPGKVVHHTTAKKGFGGTVEKISQMLNTRNSIFDKNSVKKDLLFICDKLDIYYNYFYDVASLEDYIKFLKAVGKNPDKDPIILMRKYIFKLDLDDNTTEIDLSSFYKDGRLRSWNRRGV